MRLSDIMSSMQLAFYAEVALVLFLAAFAGIAVSLFWRRPSDEWERYRRLPLDGAEDGASTSTAIGTHEP